MTDEDKHKEKTTGNEEAAEAGEPAEAAQASKAEEAAEAAESAKAAESAEAAGEPERMSEEELRQKLEEYFREQKVGDVLVQFLVSLSTLAYVKMGLTEDTVQYKDLEQAGLAIDSFKSLLEAAENRLPEQDAKALAGALASMQITFARASGG